MEGKKKKTSRERATSSFSTTKDTVCHVVRLFFSPREEEEERRRAERAASLSPARARLTLFSSPKNRAFFLLLFFLSFRKHCETAFLAQAKVRADDAEGLARLEARLRADETLLRARAVNVGVITYDGASLLHAAAPEPQYISNENLKLVLKIWLRRVCVWASDDRWLL